MYGIFGSGLLFIVNGVLITLLLVGFLIFGLSNPKTSSVQNIESDIHIQQTAENEFFNEYMQGDHSEDNPFFILDPYNMSPLTGLIMFETDVPSSYKLVVLGKTTEADIEYVTPLTTYHFIPVLGLYPDYTNTIELFEIVDGTEILLTTFEIETSPLPEIIQSPTVIETTYEYFGDDLMMLMPALGGNPVAYDYAGDVRWYLSTNLSWAPTLLNNGRLLLGTNRIIAEPYYTTGLYEIDFLGKIYVEYIVPGGFHHDVHEMNNGNLLIGTNDFLGTVEDVIIEMNRLTGEIVNTWYIEDYLPKQEGMSEMWTPHDWYHNNSVFYDENTDSIILSGRHQDIVISIDYTTDELNWVIGDPNTWSEEIVDNYFFTPIGTSFEWQYAQHSAIVLEDGNIFMFDNGNNRSKEREFDIEANNNYSRGVIYDIDTFNMTIDQVYQFGKELGSDFYSPHISNIDYYADDNYLIHSGGHSSINGEVLNIPVLLSEDFEDAVLNSITIEVLNNDIAYRLEIANNYYQAKRISLYNDLTCFNLGPTSILGNYMVTKEVSYEIEKSFSLFDTVPPIYGLSLLKEDNRLVVDGVFNNNELVYLVLENDNERFVYHIPTSKNTYLAMCTILTDLDDTNISFYINEEEVEGVFNVYLYVNGHEYNTYRKVNFK